MKNKKIVLLAGQWDTTPMVYNYLKSEYNIVKVVIEEPVPRKEFLKKRVKKLGWLPVAGQVMFQLLISKPMGKLSQKRIQAIEKQYGLQRDPVPPDVAQAVSSVNHPDTIALLSSLQPDAVVVHGTRIISKKVLAAVPCPFINVHAGITPRYRGSHGAYWALANNDAANCGVTVHLVDAGIDTGNILFQKNITVSKEDNFVTYPFLQLAEGLVLLKEAVRRVLENNIQPVQSRLDSALWHHPTIWGYLYKRITKGVK